MLVSVNLPDSEPESLEALSQIADPRYIFDVPVILPAVAIDNIDEIRERPRLCDLSRFPDQTFLQLTVSADRDA
ncbi:hypothetical protein D3C75_1359080 [compost metagenome]